MDYKHTYLENDNFIWPHVKLSKLRQNVEVTLLGHCRRQMDHTGYLW